MVGNMWTMAALAMITALWLLAAAPALAASALRKPDNDKSQINSLQGEIARLEKATGLGSKVTASAPKKNDNDKSEINSLQGEIARLEKATGLGSKVISKREDHALLSNTHAMGHTLHLNDIP